MLVFLLYLGGEFWTRSKIISRFINLLLLSFFSVKEQLSSPCCFVRATNSSYLRVVLPVQQVSVPLQHGCTVFLWQLQPFLSFPIFLHRILPILHSSEHLQYVAVVCFALVTYLFRSFCFFSFLLFFSLFYGLAIFVVFSRTRYAGTSLASPWLFGLLCFTVVVCDHIMCTRYLSRTNRHGLWVYWCRVEITAKCEDNTQALFINLCCIIR